MAVLGFLAVRPPTPGPLFLFQDGTTIYKPWLILALHLILAQQLTEKMKDVFSAVGWAFSLGNV
jgi:hypothetical protein